MALVQECLSEQQLRDYLLGRLDEQESERLEVHLRDCPTCDDTAAHLEAEDTLATHLRSVAGADPPIEDERFVASAERVKQMVPSPGEMLSDSSRGEEPSAPVDGEGPLGSYELLERIGRGGMGAVYRGRHRRLDRIVAIKLLPSRFAEDPEAIARFQREMRAVGGLDHPAIVTATDAGEHRGTHYLVMELVDGLDLARIIRALGPLPIQEACELVRQAALGLEYAHAQGVVHRDIKPSNLMLDRQGRIKILDLGLAQLGHWQQPVDEFTTVGQLMGTLDYMAPEQADSGQPTDYRADLYSLGATLYRLLCGHAPYAVTPHLSPLEKLRLLATSEPPKLATLRPDAPPELCDLVDQLLARAPSDRPAGAAVVAERLAPLCEEAAVASLLDQAQERLAEEPPAEEPRGAGVLAEAAALTAGTRDRGRGGWKVFLATAVLLPLMVLAGLFIVLETNKGQIVIESEATDVQVRLVRDGDPVEELTVRHGANATRVRAGRYEVVIDEPSDELIVSDNTFTLRRGETVVTRITRRPPTDRLSTEPDARPVSPSHAASSGPTYEGKTLDEWLAILERERAPEEIESAFTAIEALSDRPSARRITDVIFRVTRQLPEDYILFRQTTIDRRAFLLIQKLLKPQVVMEEILEQLATDDPDWQRRILSGLHPSIHFREYSGSLDTLVDRIAVLARDREHRSLSYAALGELLGFTIYQHERGESAEKALEALERAVETTPASEELFENAVAIDPSWPEPVQRVLLRWSIKQLAAEDVSDDALIRAAANISVDIPLATEISPDLPQTIAAQLARHVNPLPTSDDLVQVDRRFAERVVRLLATPLKDYGIDADVAVERMNNGYDARRRQQRTNEQVVRSGVRAVPPLLLASLAGDPALQSEDNVQIIQDVVRQLAPPLEDEIDNFGRHFDFFLSDRVAVTTPDPVQMTLYLICREGLKKATAEESTSTTAPGEGTPADVPDGADASDHSAVFVVTGSNESTNQLIRREADRLLATIRANWGADSQKKSLGIVAIKVARSEGSAKGLSTYRMSENGHPTDFQIEVMGDLEGIIKNAVPRQITHVVLAEAIGKPPRWADMGIGLLAESNENKKRSWDRFREYWDAGQLMPTDEILADKNYPSDSGKVALWYAQSMAKSSMIKSVRHCPHPAPPL